VEAVVVYPKDELSSGVSTLWPSGDRVLKSLTF